jgi:hypothetical protein
MDYNTFVNLLTANPTSKLAFNASNAGSISVHCGVVDVFKGDTSVVVSLLQKDNKFFENCSNALKVLAKVTDAGALPVSVLVAGKTYVLNSSDANDEGYVLCKVS